LIDERGNDDQATPPSGNDVPAGEQETVSWESPSAETREAQAPPPPPTQEDRVPTPWELQQEQGGGQETVAAEQPNPVGGGPAVTNEPESSRGAWEAAESRRAGELEGEAAPPSGQDDDEYKWHTTRTGRSESAESDAVEFIDVKKSFGRNAVLNGLNLGIPEDQISMILGPSGTGKSVCIKHMVGLLYPDEGDVLVHGESVPNMRDDDLFEMRKKFGVLFQDGALFGSMNLFDNVAFPLRQHTDKGEEEIVEICTRRLREVGLAGAGEKMPNELSGGMRKRAGFARALVLDPQIVLFDEPDSGLDPVRTALLCELIKEIHEENGGAYVVITHDIMSARRVAEYIAILWKGRIVESGPASELFNSDNQFVRQFLSGEARGPLGME
jgi:phospholipid/cholesterol/gamma-HCH transport system ATP-binding protein